MTNKKFIIYSVIVLLGAYMIGGYNNNNVTRNVNADTKETVYEKVIRTKTIECGYFVEAPFTQIDLKTGAFSGVSVDIAKAVAKDLGLEIKWKEEISFASFPQDLKSKKYDMVCGSIFIMPRAGTMDYTIPYAEAPINGYVLKNNKYFNKNIEDINWSGISIAGIDGEGATTAVQKIIPEAKLNLLPQLSNLSEMLMNVETGKTDIGFVLPSVFEEYNKSNPDILSKAELGNPLYTYAVSFGIAREEEAFKSMINNSINQMAVSGELKAIFKKYDALEYYR